MHFVILFSFLREKKAIVFGNLSLNLLKVLVYTKVFLWQMVWFIYLFVVICNLMIGESKNLPVTKMLEVFK